MKNKKEISLNKKIYLISVSLFLVLFLCLGCWYISRASRDIVFMDFWRNIDRIIPIVQNNSLISVLDDLWFNDFGQSNYLQVFLIALDIKFFNLNCLWEEYAGIIVLVIQALLLLYYMNKRIFTNTENRKNTIFKIIFSLLTIITIFNLNQWEILSLQFSLAFMIRLLLYELIFIMFDDAILNNKGFLKVGLLSFFSIVLLSQLYFPAMLISCFVVQMFYFIFNRQKSKENKIFLNSLKFWIPSILAVIIYLSFGVSGASAGDVSGIDKIILFLKNGTLIKSFFSMIAAGLLHQNILSAMGEMEIVIIGIVLMVFILFITVISLIKKSYKKSLVPLLLIMYGIVSIGAMIYARGDYGIFYMTSSRYTVDTNCIWIGTLILITQLMSEKIKIHKWIKVVCIVTITSTYLLVIKSYTEEIKISIYRGYYKDELITLIKENNIDEIEDDKLAPFQSTPELVRSGVSKMKEHKLNVFKKTRK